MTLKFECLHCGQHISADSAQAGQGGECPSCAQPIIVPELPSRAAPPPEPKPPVEQTKLPMAAPHDPLPKPVPAAAPTGATNQKQMAGLIGSALLFVGVFCPIVTVPIMGQMNYFQNGHGDGTIVLVLASGSAVLAFARRFPLLWLTGGASLAIIAFTFIRFQSGINEVKRQMEADLHGNPFAGLAQLAVQSVQLQWGIAILALGAILVVAAAAIPTNRTSQ